MASSLPPPAAPPVRPQRLAGRYRLDRCLAIGGMAEVWLGADEVLGRQVALKLLHPNLAHDRTFVERLQREAVAVARINHPSIVAVFDTVNDAGYEAVVMEYVPGENLRQLLDSRGRLEIDETILLGSSLADALNAAHDAGIVHRDVKPGNVLLTPEGRVKLTDFGIATAMLAVDELSDQGILLGTAKYVAPEQVQGHLVDGRTDLYSLAIVLYECLTGVVPFDGPDERSIALARLRQPVPPLRRLRPDAPPELDHLLAMTLRSRPSDRPETAAIFRTALNRIQLPAPVAPAAPPAPTDTTHHVPVDGTRAYPVDATPPFGTDAPAPEDRRVRPVVSEAARPGLDGGAPDQPAPSQLDGRRTRRRGTRHRARPRRPGPTRRPERRGRRRRAAGDDRRRGSDHRGLTDGVAGPAGGCGHRQSSAPRSSTPNPATAGSTPSSSASSPTGGQTRRGRPRAIASRPWRPRTAWAWSSGSRDRHEGTTWSSPRRSEGWSASVFVAAEVGGRLRDWGPPVDQGDDLGPGQVELHLGGADGRFVLVWFTNLGEPGCDALPHQLRVGEVTVVQA